MLNPGGSVLLGGGAAGALARANFGAGGQLLQGLCSCLILNKTQPVVRGPGWDQPLENV